ncbi:MAG: response regulator, partial [Nitrospirota bacterium]|nr:response regulator [Nitrospirota bacterium]
DQVMPGTTGKEVIRELLTIRPDLPTILCTGYGHAMNVDEPRSVGVTAFLLKPFLQDDLLSALHRVLNSEEEVGT